MRQEYSISSDVADLNNSNRYNRPSPVVGDEEEECPSYSDVFCAGTSLDTAVLDALPFDIRLEVIEEERRRRRRESERHNSRSSIETFDASALIGSHTRPYEAQNNDLSQTVHDEEWHPYRIPQQLTEQEQTQTTEAAATVEDSRHSHSEQHDISHSSLHDDDIHIPILQSSALDLNVLASLPLDIQNEVLEQERRKKLERERRNKSVKDDGRAKQSAFAPECDFAELMNPDAPIYPTLEQLSNDCQVPYTPAEDNTCAYDVAMEREKKFYEEQDHHRGSVVSTSCSSSSSVSQDQEKDVFPTSYYDSFSHRSSLDQTVLDALPDNIRQEIMEDEKRRIEQMMSTSCAGQKGKIHKITSPDGSTYEGTLQNDMQHGEGTYTALNGATYSGEWKEGKYHGQGKKCLPTGYSFEGTYHEGKLHGKGTCNFPNGDSYVGDWKNGLMDGYGTYKHTNGDVYEGPYSKGKRHGKGQYRFQDGHIDNLTFEDGTRVMDPSQGVRRRKSPPLGLRRKDPPQLKGMKSEGVVISPLDPIARKWKS